MLINLKYSGGPFHVGSQSMSLQVFFFFSLQSLFMKHRQEKMRKKPVVGRKGMGEEIFDGKTMPSGYRSSKIKERK